MAEVIITVQRFDQLKQYPILFESRFGDAMEIGTTILLAEAIPLSPLHLGVFRLGLKQEVIKRSPIEIIGRVSASAPHSFVIEGVDEADNEVPFGRRPGARLPPISVIQEWVVRKQLTIEPGQTIKSVAFAVARAIAKRGIKPVRPLRRALEAKRSEIERLFNDTAERFAKDLEGNG